MKKYKADEDLNKYAAYLLESLLKKVITEDEYFALVAESSAVAYMARKEPWEQSGHGGDALSYRFKKMMILEAVYRPGTFLDIGSANGYLVSCLYSWIGNTFPDMKFYGLEISEELTQLSRKLWPDLKDNFYIGNVFKWKPEQKFDYVYTMIMPEIPENLRKYFMSLLFSDYVKKNGRLILGEAGIDKYEKEIIQMGYNITGCCEKTVNDGRTKRIIWIDNTYG